MSVEYGDPEGEGEDYGGEGGTGRMEREQMFCLQQSGEGEAMLVRVRQGPSSATPSGFEARAPSGVYRSRVYLRLNPRRGEDEKSQKKKKKKKRHLIASLPNSSSRMHRLGNGLVQAVPELLSKHTLTEDELTLRYNSRTTVWKFILNATGTQSFWPPLHSNATLLVAWA
ncbi:hypothetical protein EG329_007104 [Mollisiaceae sp. DMI_Dod_QoI]|nr:hypothetical protein EG329_007104 [Helotiales sp. DMI_Dod_QoI]